MFLFILLCEFIFFLICIVCSHENISTNFSVISINEQKILKIDINLFNVEQNEKKQKICMIFSEHHSKIYIYMNVKMNFLTK